MKDLMALVADNFELNDLFKVGPFNRFIRIDGYEFSERIYLDEVLPDAPDKVRKAAIMDVFKKKMDDLGFESSHFLFLVFSVYPCDFDEAKINDYLMVLNEFTEREFSELHDLLASYFFYDESDELYYIAMGYESSLEVDINVLNRFLNRFFELGEYIQLNLGGLGVLYEPFFVRCDAKVVVNVYDDRGMDVVIRS